MPVAWSKRVLPAPTPQIPANRPPTSATTIQPGHRLPPLMPRAAGIHRTPRCPNVDRPRPVRKQHPPNAGSRRAIHDYPGHHAIPGQGRVAATPWPRPAIAPASRAAPSPRRRITRAGVSDDSPGARPPAPSLKPPPATTLQYPPPSRTPTRPTDGARPR